MTGSTKLRDDPIAAIGSIRKPQSEPCRIMRMSSTSSVSDEADILNQSTHEAMLHETIHKTCSKEETVTRLTVGDKYKNRLLLGKDQNGFYRCDDASSELLRSIKGKHATEHGLNALHVAARHGQGEIMSMLLDHKVDVDSKDVNGNTALHHAAGAGRLDTVIEVGRI